MTCLAWIPPAKRGIFVPPHYVLNYNFPYLIPVPSETSNNIKSNNPENPNLKSFDGNSQTVSEYFLVCHFSGKVYAFNKNFSDTEEEKDFSNFIEIDNQKPIFNKNNNGYGAENNINNKKTNDKNERIPSTSEQQKKGFRVLVNKIPKRNPIAAFSISEKPINGLLLLFHPKRKLFSFDSKQNKQRCCINTFWKMFVLCFFLIFFWNILILDNSKIRCCVCV